MKYFPLVLVFLFTSVNCQSAFTRCRLRYPRDSCYTMYSSLRDSLVADPRNIFELQQAFYPMGRFTSNVLLNVYYTVNLTEDVMFDLPTCDGAVNDPINTTEIILAGWSRSEIFNIISPIHLSELQLQISNAIYGLFVIPGSGIPLAESFGWKLHNSEEEDVDLQYANLVYINVSLDNVSCLPDQTLLMSTLQDITIMVSLLLIIYCNPILLYNIVGYFQPMYSFLMLSVLLPTVVCMNHYSADTILITLFLSHYLA